MPSTDFAALVLNHAQCAVVSVDALGLIVHWSEGARRLYGFEASEVLATEAGLLFDLTKDSPRWTEIQQAAASRGHWQGAVWLRSHSSRAMEADLFVTPLQEAEGASLGFLILAASPATSGRMTSATQTELLEAEGRMAGVMAHDFNNLLSVIRGYNEMLLEDLPPPHPGRAMLEESSKACQRATFITRQLVEFAGKQVRMPETIDVAALLVDMTPRIVAMLGPKIELAVRSTPACHTIFDRGQLASILWSLAANASDAMPQGGRLTISAERSTLGENTLGLAPGDYVLMTFADTGHGMDEAVIQRLFEPFFSTKPRSLGTGMSLATAFGMLRAHGAAIDVSSKVGQGSKLLLYLPRLPDSSDLQALKTN